MQLLNKILKYDPFNKSSLNFDRRLNILDYGCGDGHISAILTNMGHLVTAIDICPFNETKFRDLINKENQTNLKFFNSNWVTSNDIYINTFDLIICLEVLEHIKEFKVILEKLKISLNKNGYLLISIPSYYSEKLFSYLCFNWMKDSEHINLFKKNDFIQILNENGLEVIKVKNKASNWFFNWLLLCLFGVRHKMGKPITKNEFQNIVVIIVNKLILIASKTRILFLVLDFFFPKSYLLYCKKNDS